MAFRIGFLPYGVETSVIHGSGFGARAVVADDASSIGSRSGRFMARTVAKQCQLLEWFQRDLVPHPDIVRTNVLFVKFPESAERLEWAREFVQVARRPW